MVVMLGRIGHPQRHSDKDHVRRMIQRAGFGSAAGMVDVARGIRWFGLCSTLNALSNSAQQVKVAPTDVSCLTPSACLNLTRTGYEMNIL